MYAAAFIGDKIIDLAGWDQGQGAETSNLSMSSNYNFQNVSYIGGTYGRQFFRSGTMASCSFSSRFELRDALSDWYHRRVSYFIQSMPIRLANQSGCTLKLTQPYPTLMGTRQIETATGIGTITTSGLATIMLTGAGLDASPHWISVPVASGQTPSQWMSAVRTYFEVDALTKQFFNVSGSGADMILTRKSPYAGNDTTLNIAIANGTCTGITAAPTSVNTTAGVPFTPMSELTFYDASVNVSTTQVGTSVMLNTSVTGRLTAP
jgi:hypothetical protein